jgi:hypothetical protein
MSVALSLAMVLLVSKLIQSLRRALITRETKTCRLVRCSVGRIAKLVKCSLVVREGKS